MKKEYKIIKRESLVLMGFVSAWVLMFILKKMWFGFELLTYIIVYSYFFHLLTKLLIWLIRKN